MGPGFRRVGSGLLARNLGQQSVEEVLGKLNIFTKFILLIFGLLIFSGKVVEANIVAFVNCIAAIGYPMFTGYGLNQAARDRALPI